MKFSNPLTKISSIRQHRLLNDGWVMMLLFVAAAANISALSWSAAHFHKSDIAVPVRFTSLANFDILGRWYQLYYIAILSVIILVINVILAAASYKRSRMIAIFLMIVSIMVAILAAAMVYGFSVINYGTT